MKTSSKVFSGLILLCFMIRHGSAQSEPLRFMPQVAHYRIPDLTTAVDKCIGTRVSRFHVLTTATCITPIGATTGIAVRFENPVVCNYLKFD